MSTRNERLRQYVSNLVQRMPPDLVAQLAQLEQYGQLDTVLERFFVQLEATRLSAATAAAMFRAEVSPALRGATTALQLGGRSYPEVVEQVAANVVRVTAQRQPPAACA